MLSFLRNFSLNMLIVVMLIKKKRCIKQKGMEYLLIIIYNQLYIYCVTCYTISIDVSLRLSIRNSVFDMFTRLEVSDSDN